MGDFFQKIINIFFLLKKFLTFLYKVSKLQNSYYFNEKYLLHNHQICSKSETIEKNLFEIKWKCSFLFFYFIYLIS